MKTPKQPKNKGQLKKAQPETAAVQQPWNRHSIQGKVNVTREKVAEHRAQALADAADGEAQDRISAFVRQGDVLVQLPAGTGNVNVGGVNYQPDGNGQIVVPASVVDLLRDHGIVPVHELAGSAHKAHGQGGHGGSSAPAAGEAQGEPAAAVEGAETGEAGDGNGDGTGEEEE